MVYIPQDVLPLSSHRPIFPLGPSSSVFRSQRHLRRLRSVHDETTASLDQPAGIDWPCKRVISGYSWHYDGLYILKMCINNYLDKMDYTSYTWDYQYLELVVSNYI